MINADKDPTGNGQDQTYAPTATTQSVFITSDRAVVLSIVIVALVILLILLFNHARDL